MSAEENAERLRNELDLLEAMYPGQSQYDEKYREFKFEDADTVQLTLHLPVGYPGDENAAPKILSATTSVGEKQDVRTSLKARLDAANLSKGEEALDAILGSLNDLVQEQRAEESARLRADAAKSHSNISKHANTGDPPDSHMTVIIWLHHLLATSKRKAALSPPQQQGEKKVVSGICKPGYPGVMIFSGPRPLVQEHVQELKGMKWQAFQIRLEEVHDESKLWQFEHGEGVTEVEGMGDVVKDITKDENQSKAVSALGIR